MKALGDADTTPVQVEAASTGAKDLWPGRRDQAHAALREIISGGWRNVAFSWAETPGTQPASQSASPASPSAGSWQAQPAYPLWDGNESVADYAKRAGIKDVQITLTLDGNVTMKLTLIPAGKFLMGSPEGEMDRQYDEGPQHEVRISRPFYMGIYHVTQDQYEQITGKNPSRFKGAQNPVAGISWDDAVAFCTKLSQKKGRAVSLPTEAQWEYSCRAGSTSRFSFGDDANKLDDYAWHNGNSNKARPVGQKNPNDFALYDMHGNVSQWCSDWYAETYANASQTDPTGPASDSTRVARGGSWNADPRNCRSASRGRRFPADRGDLTGFRVAMELPAAPPIQSPAAAPFGTPATSPSGPAPATATPK
jgi:formylglycine-generating enzyme required for sulfatase activity